ncbi:CaiB/BaiF CoA transferase family protein [Thalassovita taeanensis]|uniref:Crotonobetainyl-CoA:carnitine CoA-transferase CaiB n=1 Tax=Thalassovita taeanensis TaxID=657014 RepID=A0A1H9BW66_9RHOB|nr:CoA transferase [Thalassovita taeanensis]SEP93180.1 Crotonobetainyl-CoA:carnitine CoA-transferase CaiB [Thalassovita taeanensis]
MTMPKPLDGVRVLDFSKVLAGPLCTQYMADMGADIIKVEPLGLGDETRAWPPFEADMGTVFLSANRGKRSLSVDMKSIEGQALIRRILPTCDVVIESFGTGVSERLGIDYNSLRAIHPDVIYCSISGFGRRGPMKNAPGYDVILQAFSGVMSLTGEEGGSPIRSPISPIDQTTGIHALTGILAALYARKSGQGGQIVEVSLFETAMGLLAYNLQSFWQRGVQPDKCGSSHESLCPYQTFEASDGIVMIGVANDNLWRKFCAIADLDGIRDDPRFATNPNRVANRAETLRLVQDAIAKQPVSYWDTELAKVKVPCAPLNTLAQMLDHPHTAATGMVMPYDHPAAGPLNAVAQPVQFGGNPRSVVRHPPQLGEHTAEILQEAGLTETEIASLQASGIVKIRP